MFTQLTVMQKFERSDLNSFQDNTTSETDQLPPLNMLHIHLKKKKKQQQYLWPKKTLILCERKLLIKCNC